jgi:hypothetical protein
MTGENADHPGYRLIEPSTRPLLRSVPCPVRHPFGCDEQSVLVGREDHRIAKEEMMQRSSPLACPDLICIM